MSIVKSFSFSEGQIRGDMFYIKHASDCFTLIDCYLKNMDDRDNSIIQEIKEASSDKKITRFISTHPDRDHILGLENLWKSWSTTNFYAVHNSVPSEEDNSSLDKYIELRDNNNCAIKRGLIRAFLNKEGVSDEGEISSSGITFLWPKLDNEKFKKALKQANEGGSPNNICPVIKYSIKDGPTFMWMGDMETDMQQEFYDSCKNEIESVDVLFAPHHGRESGSIPADLLKVLDPKIIVIGDAPSEHIHYYESALTITQNSSGDICFETEGSSVRVYTSNNIENKPECLKYNFSDFLKFKEDAHYIGTFTV